jgi:hypothetical protein
MALTIKTDTGLLDKIIANVGNADTDTFIIADGVDYGIYQEFGTKRMAAQPFLIPAFEDATKSLPAAMGQAVERGVNPNDVLKKTAFDIQGNAQKRAPVDTGALKNSIHTEVK